VLLAVTPGTVEAMDAAELLSSPEPVGVMMRSALIAWSTLLVADRETEAPNTDIAATRARPTMSAAAVWAVRRGLRMEFSRPSLPGSPSTRASGRPITLDSGAGDGRGQGGGPEEDGDRTEPDERDGRLGQPDGQQGSRRPGPGPCRR